MTGGWAAPGRETMRPAPSSSPPLDPYFDYGPAPLPGRPPAAAAAGPAVRTAPAPDPFHLPPELAQQILAGPGYESPRARNSVLSILTIVLAIPLFFVPGASLVVIALGHLAIHQLTGSHHGGRGLALGGLTLAYLSVVGWAAFYLL